MHIAITARSGIRAAVAAIGTMLLVGASPPTQSYTVDSGGSDVSARVSFLGIGNKTAGFPKVSGTVALTPTRPDQIALDVTVDARALTAPDDGTLGRLRGEKFFWVDRYPTVRFTGDRMALTSDRAGAVTGRLTARGVTQPVTLTVSFDKPPRSLARGEAVTLTGRTTIDRRKFGMKSYALIVGNKVNITLKARMVPG